MLIFTVVCYDINKYDHIDYTVMQDTHI